MKVFNIRSLRVARVRIIAVGIIYAILTSGLPMNHNCQHTSCHYGFCDQEHTCSAQTRLCHTENDRTQMNTLAKVSHGTCVACLYSLLAESTCVSHVYTYTHSDIVIIQHAFAYEPVILVCPYLISHCLRAPPSITG
jgi:hypothetical protein